MKNYQLMKNNKYLLDKTHFRRIIYLVKDYDRMKTLINNVATSLPNSKALLSGSQHTDPAIGKVLKVKRISEKCKAAEWTLEQIPFYQKIIFNKVRYDTAYPLYTDLSTYSR